MNLEQYVGLPFKDHGRDRKGLDCWGLVLLVYKEQFGILLPDLGDSYIDTSAKSRADIQKMVCNVALEEWAMDVTEFPRKQGDVLVFKRGNIETHVGLWVREHIMLHVEYGVSTTLERYDDFRWRPKLSRILRHANIGV